MKKGGFEKNTRGSLIRHFDNYFLKQIFFNFLGSFFGILWIFSNLASFTI